MDEQKKKARDWSFLLPAGKPTRKQRLELKKIKDMMKELEVDVAGFDLDTEESFRDFIMAKTTPKDDIEQFLKKIFSDNGIEYTGTGFRRLVKKDCLELFFELFTLGMGGGETAESVEPVQFSAPETEASTSVENVSDDSGAAQPALFTMAMMDELYKKRQKEIITSINVADLKITDQISVREQDEVFLRFEADAPDITHSKAALYNTHVQKTVAVGYLAGKKQAPRLVFLAKDIDYETIRKNQKHEIIFFPMDEKADVFYAVERDLELQELETTKRTLCIDFGTSNTTAGSYGIRDEQANEPEIVEFPDVDGITVRQMIPTLVYVDSCEDGQPVRYAFGYEARKRIAADHFESRAKVFHEIKSWMNDLERTEKIFDADGNNAEVRREDVIKAYLSHIISLSEQYFCKRFKALHFSAPVKLKDSFLSKMRQMFPGYSILRNESCLDEGIAIVYNHIAKRIKDMGEGNTETVFVIDCGGGTTDLARCEYSYAAAAIGDGKKILSVKTGFENGDSGFGGNNITYRILQLLKIKIDAYLRQQPNPDMLEILSDNEIDIMTKLDEPPKGKNIYDVKDELYKKFTEAYEGAEERIPTRYEDEKYRFPNDKSKMRRNYNYLWQMAESIKIEFYKSSSTVSVDFAKEEDRNICIGGQEDYYLYTRGDLDAAMEKKMAPLGNIRITIKEISRIICPDIYTLLSILLGKYDNASLQDVNYYKLSGQSCNITLFHDLMKEFVPGRYIRRNSQSMSDEDRSEQMKLACIEGSIRYLMAKEFSQIQPKFDMASPEMLYQVVEDLGDDNEKTALGHGTGKEGEEETRVEKAWVLPHFISARNARFIVRDLYGQQKNDFLYEFVTDKDKREDVSLGDLKLRLIDDTYWTPDMVEECIITALNNITLHSREDEQQIIFLLPAKNGYGFRVYQVRVGYGVNGETIYSLIRNETDAHKYGVYHTFEQMASFFDGLR